MRAFNRRSRFAGQGGKLAAVTALRAGIEFLESRTLLTSVVVNTVVDGLFPPSTGLVSLRNAIATANSNSAPTTITFDPTVFAGGKTITLNGTQLELSNSQQSTTITGPSAGVTINGNKQSSDLQIDDRVPVSITGVSFTGANSSAITNSGVLTLNHSTISGNTDTFGRGAAIDNTYTMTLLNSTVSGNSESSYQGAGAIVNTSKLTLTNVSVSGNTATYLNTPSTMAGGILSEDGGTLTMTNSTIAGNTSKDGAGGIFVTDGMTLTNVTISGNSVTGNSIYDAGGIIATGGPVVLNDTTVSLNTGHVGGVYNRSISSPTLVNTIVSGNTATGTGTSSDVSGPFNSLGSNLIGKTDGSTGFNAADFTGTLAKPLNAKLGPLASNGGPTLTMLPLAGSPAIDHGFNALIPSSLKTDQRGLPRIVNTTVDIGAVEVQPASTGGAGTLTGNVFSDVNANGKLDTGEKGLAGVTVYIDTNKNGLLDTTEVKVTTDASGNFKFTNLSAATYRVREVLPPGYALIAPTVGYFDVPVVSGATASASIFADALATASITGRVFNDVNSNGLRDVGEAGLGLWKVYIDLNNNGVFDGKDVSVVTDINGNWSFNGLVAGTYAVRVVPVSGLVATKPTGGVLTLVLTAGKASAGNLFGEKSVS